MKHKIYSRWDITLGVVTKLLINMGQTAIRGNISVKTVLAMPCQKKLFHGLKLYKQWIQNMEPLYWVIIFFSKNINIAHAFNTLQNYSIKHNP